MRPDLSVTNAPSELRGFSLEDSMSSTTRFPGGSTLCAASGSSRASVSAVVLITVQRVQRTKAEPQPPERDARRHDALRNGPASPPRRSGAAVGSSAGGDFMLLSRSACPSKSKQHSRADQWLPARRISCELASHCGLPGRSNQLDWHVKVVRAAPKNLDRPAQTL